MAQERKDWKYSLVRGTFYLVSLLPFCVLYAIASMLCPIVYHVARYRRPIVRKNLTNAFPEKSFKEIKSIERKFYKFFCDYFVETVKLFSIPEEKMRKRMTFDGVEDMVRSLETHDFCFVYLGHYGNWEWMSTLPLWVPKGVHCAQLYHPLRSEAFDRLFLALRGRFGGENISKYDTLRRVISLRKEGTKTIIGFISDQTPRWINIHDWVTFLNQDTGVFTGTERIGKKVNASIYYGDMHVEGRGHYHCSFKKMTDDVNSYEDYRITEQYMHLLEQTIKAEPYPWLWSHNRWKRQRSQQNEEH